MIVVELCMCIIFLLTIYLTNIHVVSLEIECVPIENCPFATNILAKRRYNKDVIDFLNFSRCGIEETTKSIKVWCNRFTNCRTPDSRSGTCIHVSKCAELTDIMQSADINQNTRNLLSGYRCYLPTELEVHVCCPWPNSVKTERPVKPLQWNQEGVGQRRRNIAYYPWHGHNHENCFHGQHHDFHPHFHGPNFGNADNRFDLENSLEKNFGKPSTIGHNDNFPNWWDHGWLDNESGSKKHSHHSADDNSFSTEGSCLTPDNSEGKCKEIRECPTMINILKNVNSTDYVQVDYLKKFRCSNKGRNKIRVCCSDTPIILPNNTVAVTGKVDPNDGDNTILESASCGRQISDDKIIGGTTTGLAEFPWTALLQYRTSRGLLYGCGGSIISKRYIVTAAHCVNKTILKQVGFQNIDKVILGEYDTRNETDCIYTRYGSDCADAPQYFNIERIIEHELFGSNGTLHDIALIRVDRDIKFSNYIMPICLPNKKSFQLLGNESFFITGWGRTETGATSPVKRKARLPFVDKVNCNQLGLLGDGQMCLGSGKTADSCRGDSGGPVMHTAMSSGELVSTLVGIISYGFGPCGTTSSVSTYVPFYSDWISNNLS